MLRIWTDSELRLWFLVTLCTLRSSVFPHFCRPIERFSFSLLIRSCLGRCRSLGLSFLTRKIPSLVSSSISATALPARKGCHLPGLVFTQCQGMNQRGAWASLRRWGAWHRPSHRHYLQLSVFNGEECLTKGLRARAVGDAVDQFVTFTVNQGEMLQ